MRNRLVVRLVAPAFLILLPALAALPGPGWAEIYKWTDDTGRMHFTQDLNQVPPAKRAAAKAAAKAPRGPDRIQTYSPPASAARRAPRRRAISGAASAGPGQTWRIRVRKAGTSLMATVRLNDRVDASFVLDTGASDVVLPRSVADELGLAQGVGRTKVYSTANGLVTQEAVTLDSVSLGGARVENVVASISPSMDVGLLGLSYFNHFQYSFDPAAGLVTLTRNRLAAEGLIRGGRSEAQWRSEFGGIAARIEAVESELRSKSAAKSRTRDALKAQIAELERQRDLLEDEADSARVPFQWRD